ncbi:glycoside hydrolase family 78 protein [Rathayibacter festucae]|uniref:family 78 glycoside hydrolase catalytic domain n=1 Tax=Rathayibacter festucae TaxID=110937 RepID=UPI001FB3EC78|nr:family 78 glycoside hydrolase catalytic domain [Rathayibacter festucae]MCJ1700234.1 glycoside hydrolase family 78 protein [Rathayibacter festucae]
MSAHDEQVPPAPFALTVDSGGDRVPTTTDSPRLSWKLPVGGAAQRYEIDAVVDDRLLPVAHATSSTFVEWPWAALPSRSRVEWRVRAERPGAAWSRWAAFEVGLLAEDWTAPWISPAPPAADDEDADGPAGRRPAHLLSVDVELEQEVRSARLYSTALGLYTATINGSRVGAVELSPGSTSYDRTLHAQATDVTDALRTGANRIEVELSDGWYRGEVGAFRVPADWGTTLGFRAELHLELADGSHRVIGTDDSWVSAPSRITGAGLMDGQTLDLTAAEAPAQPVLADVVDAPAIEWSPAPPVRVIEARGPVGAREVRPGVWVLDFGQNASGRLRLEELGPEGTRTVLEFGEHCGPDGDLSTAHLDSHRPGEPATLFVQRDEVVAGATPDVFEPRHTVHGFQYARITRHGAPFDPSTASMRIMHTDLESAGTFACSDPDLVRLHEIAEWSFRGNAVDVPTDCPTRERLAWSGDYQVFVSTATRLFDVHGFTRKWLRSVRDDQLDDGRITNFSPDGRRIKHHVDQQFAQMTGSAGWGDAIVAVPWELYRESGDRLVLEENVAAMIRWVEWALEQARTKRHHVRVQRSPEPEWFEEFLWDGTFHWGEWIEPREHDADGRPIDPVQADPMAWFTADKGEVGTAYLHRSTATLARIAGLLGRSADADRYAALAERIRDAWQAAYLREDGITSVDSQASYVRALSFGLVPEHLRAAAADRLVELIHAADDHLGTGFLSTGDLLPVLTEAGRADVAYSLLRRRTAPSWLHMLDRGATTVWEDWEGIDDAGHAHESLNHYSKGAVVRFLHSHLLGLRQDEDSTGWRSVVVAPVPGPDLDWARGTHESPRGTLRVEWRREGDDLVVDVDLPEGTTGRLLFPDGHELPLAPGATRAARPLPAASAAPDHAAPDHDAALATAQTEGRS